MSNTSINLVDLDFESRKEQLKNYLKSQARFKDFNFDGSNISVLLGLLSYNDLMQIFYLNMDANERFLSTSVTRDSVVSHAKDLNYTPRSFRSAVANVSLKVTTSANVSSLIMPKGFSFTSRVGSNTFTFTTDETHILNSSNGEFWANNISIYEGAYVYEAFNMNYSNTLQNFTLSNHNIDTDSLRLNVIENSGANNLTYKRAVSLFGLDKNSQIFFVQATEDEQYEILFGDGVIGRRPVDGSLITAEYRVSSGELPNGASVFYNDNAVDSQANVVIYTNHYADGGAISESISSVKFNAPRHFNSQERAVGGEDYETILKIQFPEINAVSVYGGEDADPPRYGTVMVAVDLDNIDGLPENKKTIYTNFLKPRMPLCIKPMFIDPDYLYGHVHTHVRYNLNTTNLNPEDIKLLVKTAILAYNKTNLDDFNVALRYSTLVNVIDESQSSIISNDTDVHALRKLRPLLNTNQSLNVNFGVPLIDDLPYVDPVHRADTLHAVTSSQFFYRNQPVHLEDDGNGVMRIVSVDQSNSHRTLLEIGTVDYATGLIQLNNFNISGYSGRSLDIHAITKDKDIIVSRGTILSLVDEDIFITVEGIRE